MSPRFPCVNCGRRFQAAAALPVAVSNVKRIGSYVATQQRWEAGCPECYCWNEAKQEAMLRQAVTP